MVQLTLHIIPIKLPNFRLNCSGLKLFTVPDKETNSTDAHTKTYSQAQTGLNAHCFHWILQLPKCLKTLWSTHIRTQENSAFFSCNSTKKLAINNLYSSHHPNMAFTTSHVLFRETWNSSASFFCIFSELKIKWPVTSNKTTFAYNFTFRTSQRQLLFVQFILNAHLHLLSRLLLRDSEVVSVLHNNKTSVFFPCRFFSWLLHTYT